MPCTALKDHQLIMHCSRFFPQEICTAVCRSHSLIQVETDLAQLLFYANQGALRLHCTALHTKRARFEVFIAIVRTICGIFRLP